MIEHSSGCLVSVVIPTKNEALRLPRLVESIREQTYPTIEIIVVDNFSIDGTDLAVAGQIDRFISFGPERSAQRNRGWQVATGTYLLFLDADMVLTQTVVEECVRHAVASNAVAIVIPERSFGEGFWARCKVLERECYVGDPTIEAPRFFSRELFESLNGYDTSLTGFEDWDLTRRARAVARIDRIEAEVLHDEGRLLFLTTLRKKKYYARDFATYCSKHGIALGQVSPFRGAFFRNRGRLLRSPLLAGGMLFLKICETFAGLIGVLQSSFERIRE